MLLLANTSYSFRNSINGDFKPSDLKELEKNKNLLIEELNVEVIWFQQHVDKIRKHFRS